MLDLKGVGLSHPFQNTLYLDFYRYLRHHGLPPAELLLPRGLHDGGRGRQVALVKADAPLLVERLLLGAVAGGEAEAVVLIVHLMIVHQQ